MYHEGLVRKPYKYMAKMIPDTLVQFFIASQIKIFSKSSLAILKSKMAKNGHFKAFLERQEGNEEYSKMDDTKVTSTVYHCRSDNSIFGELHGHFEMQIGFLIFEAKNGHFGF